MTFSFGVLYPRLVKVILCISGDGHRQTSAEIERRKGNEFYREQNYAKAIQHYNKSIALSPTAAAYTNRALSRK